MNTFNQMVPSFVMAHPIILLVPILTAVFLLYGFGEYLSKKFKIAFLTFSCAASVLLCLWFETASFKSLTHFMAASPRLAQAFYFSLLVFAVAYFFWSSADRKRIAKNFHNTERN